jgi:hypothetical protein
MLAEDGVEIHLLERHASIGDLPAGDDREAVDQGLGLGAPVCLDVGNGDPPPFGLRLAGRKQRGVRLADAGGVPEKDPELASAVPALFGLGFL